MPREDGAEVEAGAGSLDAGAGSGKQRRHLKRAGCAPVRVNRAGCEMRRVAVLQLQGRAVVWAGPQRWAGLQPPPLSVWGAMKVYPK